MTDPLRRPKTFAEVLRKEAERLGRGPRQPMDPRDALLAGAEALEERDHRRTCGGCPDCLGIGAGDEIRALRAERDRMKAAVLATAAYFDALLKWSDENQSSDKDTHCIPAGSQPVLDETLSVAIDAVKAARKGQS